MTKSTPSGRRSTLRHTDGIARDLRSMTRQALSGLAFEASISACVVPRSTIYTLLPCPSHIRLMIFYRPNVISRKDLSTYLQIEPSFDVVGRREPPPSQYRYLVVISTDRFVMDNVMSMSVVIALTDCIIGRLHGVRDAHVGGNLGRVTIFVPDSSLSDNAYQNKTRHTISLLERKELSVEGLLLS